MRFISTSVLSRLTVLAVVIWPGPSLAQDLSGEALLKALRAGGYNIYFRHAPTDWAQQDHVDAAGDWLSCDGDKMRQLSAGGRALAREVGGAIRALAIPVARLLSSEYCRAVQTARQLDLGPVETTPDIMNMRVADYVGGRDAVVRRARTVLSTAPPEGSNVVIVGHGNLMQAATGAYAGEAGSAIYAPSATGGEGFSLVAELSSEDWLQLADRFRGGGGQTPGR